MIEVGKVGMVDINSIIVEDRAREVLGDLDAMEENMRKTGLISPIALRDNGDGTYKLLAGERRYTVLKRNSVTEVPARIFDHDLSEMEMKVIEKSENFFRKDMEYWEMDRLTMEIHKMQQEIYGVKAPGPGSSGWTVEDTGKLMGGISKGAVSQALNRAKIREQLPDLFENCKKASDADKLIKQLDEALVKQTMAEKIEKKTASVDIQKLANSFILKSAFEGLSDIPSGVFQLIEIDPPYAVDLKEAKKKDSTNLALTEYNEVPESVYMDGDSGPWKGMRELFKQCYRVMAEHSWLLCWFAPEPWFEAIYSALLDAGFQTTRLCPVWAKPSGQTKRPELHLPNSYEMFFYAWKGRPAIAQSRATNVFTTSPIPHQQKVHPTERPVELMKEIYSTFAFPGSRILIPFLGSGNGLLAAHQVGMPALGFELTKSFKDSFLVKLNDLKS